MSNEPSKKFLSGLVQELRSHQADLEAQNQALRYSRMVAEGASERFESLFSKVPLALMVVDELGMVVQSNAMALRLFRPQESDPPLNFLLPLVDEAHLQRVGHTFEEARIVCVDTAQLITVFNPAAATLFECPAVDALNTSLARFLPETMKALATTQVATHALLGEQAGLTASGKPLALEVSISFERLPLGTVTTVFARDLTARKAMEAQLRQSHKMQAMGTMAGGIAHDFNNILGAILGNVELARQDAGAESPSQVSLTEIEKAGRRARDLVRQILTFSRNEAPRRLPLHLVEALRETARLLKVALPPAIKLQLRVDDRAPAVLADATQVEQALLNLCTNAIHAIGQARGTISVELGQARLDARSCEPLGLLAGHYATLTVRDSGSGIDAATLQRIFEPFFTTKPVDQGTGLGLAVVHGVMHSHLGTVDVQSTLGVGSVFTLYFPALVGQVESASLAPTRADPVSGAGKHVMYVDDDQALVFLVKRALLRRGFKITTFTDPRAALVALREQPQDFDLLVTDYNMPGFSGVELLREVQLIYPDLPVALASGYVTPEIEQDALAAGALALIHKPNDVGELCDTVQRLVQGKVAG